MQYFEDIVSALNRDIQIHEHLRDSIRKECIEMRNNLDQFSGDNFIDKGIEEELDQVTQVVCQFLNARNSKLDSGDDVSVSYINRQVGILRDAIQDTLSVIRESVHTLSLEKNEIVQHMKKLDTNKNAVKAYAKFM